MIIKKFFCSMLNLNTQKFRVISGKITTYHVQKISIYDLFQE